MLAVTENAAAAIRDLTSQPTVPDGAGLRIAADPQGGALSLSLAPLPKAGDQIVNAAGARLFIDADAATLLDDKALDAVVDGTGTVEFAVSPQSD
ncbi:adhesin [Actinoplanes sp. NPDC048967]|uniref:adhesin n=1 Tax=Actinoplanes sp. NPDC048967 TaxID=3155269 RepID=UPI0034117A8E